MPSFVESWEHHFEMGPAGEHAVGMQGPRKHTLDDHLVKLHVVAVHVANLNLLASLNRVSFFLQKKGLQKGGKDGCYWLFGSFQQI